MRGLARTREIAVRIAIGAARGQVVAQLVTENAILAAAGGVLGVLVAAVATQGFVSFAPASVPRLEEIELDGTALAGAVAITGVAMLLCGLAPAFMTSRVSPQAALRTVRHSASRSTRLATEALVAAQIALAALVLFAAGLVGRSLIALQSAQLAFEPSRLLIGELAFRYEQVESKEKQLALLDGLLPEVRAIPGILSASPVVAVPFAGAEGWDGQLASEGQTMEETAGNPILNIEVVVRDYFATSAFHSSADASSRTPTAMGRRQC